MYNEIFRVKANKWSPEKAHHYIINGIAEQKWNVRLSLIPTKGTAFFSMSSYQIDKLCGFENLYPKNEGTNNYHHISVQMSNQRTE